MERRKFLQDERAVSPIIGFMFVLVIVISVMSFMQVRHVPVWNQEVEYKHVNAEYDEMTVLGSDITNVFNYQVPKMCALHLGVQYPKRGIFYNPTDALIGTLTVNPEHNITVEYTKFSGSTGGETYPSCSLTYNAYGTTPHAKIVYEHGVVIRDYGIYGNATSGKQLLIGEDGNVNIPVLNGTDRILTSKGVETLTIEPYSRKEPVIGIQYANVTLTTNYPEVWRTILANANTSGTNATVVGNKIHINSTKKDQILSLCDLTNWQSDRLYSGIVAIAPDPGVGHSGTGQGSVSSGTVWPNIPSSDEITKLDISNIIVDENNVDGLVHDFIKMVVTDYEGNWWTVEIEFDLPQTKGTKTINDITATAKGKDSSVYKSELLPPPPFYANTTIDLLNELNYELTDSCYKNANISFVNTLHTEVSDGSTPGDVAVRYFYLTVE